MFTESTILQPKHDGYHVYVRYGTCVDDSNTIKHCLFVYTEHEYAYDIWKEFCSTTYTKFMCIGHEDDWNFCVIKSCEFLKYKNCDDNSGALKFTVILNDCEFQKLLDKKFKFVIDYKKNDIITFMTFCLIVK